MSSLGIQDYLSDIGRLPILTKEAQLLHCQKIYAWMNHPDGKDNAPLKIRKAGRHSMDQMVSTNLRIVVSVARNYQNRGLDIQDLIQEGNIGLMRGLELYNPERGYAVSTYVYWWIRQAITRAILLHGRTVRIPINNYEIASRAKKIKREFCSQHGRNPTMPEIASRLKISLERLECCLDTIETTRCHSLDMCSYEGNASLIDFIPSEVTNDYNDYYEEEIFNIGTPEAILAASSRLTTLENRVVEGIFLKEITMRDLAEELKVSRSRIAQIRDSALFKLRKYLNQYSRSVDKAPLSFQQ